MKSSPKKKKKKSKLMKMNDIKNEVINLHVKRLNFQPGSRKRQFLDDFSGED